jgi:hypothetical protein
MHSSAAPKHPRSKIAAIASLLLALAPACSSGSGDGTPDATTTPETGSGGSSPIDSGHEAEAAAPGQLGAKCTSDAECGSPALNCILATGTSLGGGGPANGYCSAHCAQADDPVCTALGAKCLDFARNPGDPPDTWCVETCTRGGDAPSLAKCHGRRDVACTPVSVTGGTPSADGYCLPTCSSDDDCAGRHCDPLFGVCTDAPSAGAPTGTHCDPDADGGTGCAGVCLSVGPSTHVCADRCVYLSPDGCHLPGKALEGGVSTYSACLFISEGTGAGDEASCGQLCDTVDDCLDKVDPGVFCDTSPDVIKAYGHGFCNWGSGGNVSDGAAPDAGDGPEPDDGGESSGDGSSPTDGAPE